MAVIIVHGSVETSEAVPYIQGLRAAAENGYQRLASGRMEAVLAAVNALEDNPLFNAGFGSVLNLDGHVEVDGSIMDGHTGRFAGVAAMPNTRYAITTAYQLMHHSKHVLLAGAGAAKFARAQGIPEDDCVTEEQRASYQHAMRLLADGKELTFSPYTGLAKETDTVGCVVVDAHGRLAAGSSTGGSFLKHPGRVGDTPVIGGGIFASDVAAVVCTGRGEAFIQTLTAKYVDDEIRAGGHPQQVAVAAVERMRRITGENGGVIVVGSDARIGIAHNCASFPVFAVIDGKSQPCLQTKIS